MSTADGKPTKTNEEIEHENVEIAKLLMGHGPLSAETEVLFAIFTRLGDIWLWAKERR